jgi:ABC-type polysaccharide/polyol phosphate transport system ATPase subunit
MSDVVIRAEELGKKYIIGHQAERERYTTLRDSVGRSLKNWSRSAREMFAGKSLVPGDETEEFWALKDINFEIKRGDVVGIIGRNGAGKSTLLKVLSRITEPTTGRVTIDGRVASLLEVGTGFHPELSGRENIYLNGAILGMNREEIKRKFDEIVDFADVEKFLDTPVKRYSSGMYVRLAFAVAAHLEPEILIIDEVLAVGDAEFQKKCLGKMKDVAGHGRTVLFVSHNMAAVQNLCNSGLLIFAGNSSETLDVATAINKYQMRSAPSAQQKPRRSKVTQGPVFLVDAKASPTYLTGAGKLKITLEIESLNILQVVINLFVFDQNQYPVGAVSIGGLGAIDGVLLQPGLNTIVLMLDLPRLAQGAYSVTVEIADKMKNQYSDLQNALSFSSEPAYQQGETEVLRQDWQFGSNWFACHQLSDPNCIGEILS